VDLRYGGDAQARILQRAFHILGLGLRVRDDVDGILLPAHAGSNQQAFFVWLIFQHLCKLRLQSAGAEFGGFLKDHLEIPGLHGGAAEFAQQRLLP
jgi:hypothetical protein